MRRGSIVVAELALLAASAACRARPGVVPARARPVWEHCWWTVLLTTAPPDTVAARFAAAYTATGLSAAAWTRAGDTAWAHAGPPVPNTVTPGASPGAGTAARLVAVRYGDTTRFRHFVAAGGSSNGGSVTIPLCTGIARSAAVRTLVPQRGPRAEDSLPVWWREP